MYSKTVIARAFAVAILATVAFNTPSARADELPGEGGGCSGNLVSSSTMSHCCLYNSCLFGILERTNSFTHEVYENPGCSVNTHTGSPGGCCSA